MKRKLSIVLAICMLFTCITPYGYATTVTDSLVEQFNNMASVAKMQAFLEDNSDALALEMSDYAQLSSEGRYQVAKKLLGSIVSDLTQIRELFHVAVQDVLNSASDVAAGGTGGGGFDEEFLQSGTCGETVYWGLGESGTLYVYGAGKMYDYASVSEVPWYAYKTQITSVEVLDGVTYIGTRAFRDTYVEKAKIASSVTATGTSLFNSASKLTSVDLGGNISHLNNYVFYNCDALKSIDLKGVNSVGSNTFASCGVLSSVAFYKGLTSIGASAFSGDSKLSDLYYEGTADEWANVSIASGNTSLTALTPRGTVEGTCGDDLLWAIKGNNLIISGTGKMYDFASTSEVPWCSYKSKIEKIDIEEGITHIGSRAFRDLNITEVVIPEGVTSAGTSIFNTCAKLKYVTLPSTLKAIPNYMLYNCDALKSIDLSYVTSIGTSAFGTCGALSEIKLSSALKTVSASAFDASTKLTDIYYDGTESQWKAISVSSTGNAPFKAATVHYAEMPENIVALGTCGDSLQWVVDTDGVLTISGTGKMYDYASVSEVPWYAYKSQIKSLKIEDGITYIGTRAFRDLSITSVVIPEGVVSTGTSIFNNCLKLAEVTLPSTLTAIANYTFNNCDALTNVDLSYAKTIGTYAFATCGVLSKVTLSKDLVSVASNAFSASTKLTDVYYDGTESDWANVSVASGNDPLINAVFYFSEAEEVITIKQPDNLRYKYGEPIDLTGVVVESSTKGVILEITGDYKVTGYNPFITTAQNITVTSNGLSAVITIEGFNPFLSGTQTGTISYGGVSIDVTIEIVKLSYINIVNMPEKTVYAEGEELDLAGLAVEAVYSDGSSEEITDYTVSGYDATVLGEQEITVAYENLTATFTVTVKEKSGTCGEIVTWTLNSEGVLTISGTGEMKDYADATDVPWYIYIDEITSVVIENGVTATGYRAFCGCTNLTSVEISDSVALIDKYTFYDCDSLSYVKIGSGVTTINRWAFADCDSLASVEIPESVTTIADYAFENCGSLTDVYYDGTENDWNSNVAVGIKNESLLNATFHFAAAPVEPVGLQIIGEPLKNWYNQGDTYFDTDGLWVELVYSDGSTENVTSKVTLSGYDLNVSGYQDVTVEYMGFTATFSIYVEPPMPPEFLGITIVSTPYKTVYNIGEEIDLDGLIVEASYSDGSTVDVTDQVSISGFDTSCPGVHEVWVYLGECPGGYFEITVNDNPPIPDGEPYIRISENSTHRYDFMEGEPFDAAGLEIMYYNGFDGEVPVIYGDETASINVDFSQYNEYQAGSYEIIVYYEGLQLSYWVNVTMGPGPVEDYVAMIMIETLPDKLEYQIGEVFDSTGLTVKAVYMYGDMVDITSECWINFDESLMSEAGTYWIEVGYIDPILGQPYTEGFEITVVEPEKELASIEIESLPTQTNYYVGDKINLDGLKVNAVYSDGSREEITDYTVFGYDMSVAGEQMVVVMYQDFDAFFEITVEVAVAEYVVAIYKEELDGTYSVAEWTNNIAEVGTEINLVSSEEELQNLLTRYDGFTLDLTNAETVTQGEVKADNSTEFKLFYARKTYDVVYNLGEAGGSYTAAYKYGTNMDLAAPAVTAPEGKYFDGWVDANGNPVASLTVPVGGVTIYAKWAESEIPVTTYTVTFVDYDGKVIETQTVEKGKSASAPLEENIPVPEGYVFKGWDTEFNNVQSDLTVKAVYTESPIMASGNLNENISWTLYRTGVLELTGSGEMPDCSADSAPWVEYRENIEVINLSDKSTTIGAYAFYNCINLTTVTGAYNVTRIGEHAFDGCAKLANIDSSEDVVVGTGAFTGCILMTRIPISDGRTEIDPGEFKDFGFVESIVIPEGVTVIKENAFMGCASASIISLPSTIREIHAGAFAGCGSIEQVYYNGTKTQWAQVSVAEGNENITENLHFLKFTVKFVDYYKNELKTEIVEVGGSATPPEAPALEGYKFLGWNGEYTNVTFDITIYATYESVELVDYKIEYYYETAIGSGEYYKADTWTTSKAYPGEYTVSLAKEVEHMGFKHTLNETKSELKKIVASDGSTVFKAYYDKTEVLPEPPEPTYYKVTFKAKIGESVEVFSTRDIEEGHYVSLPEPPVYAGYKFAGWDGVTTGQVGPITGDTTIIALYVYDGPTGYTVTLIAKDGVTVVDALSVEAGNTVALPDAPYVDGYKFAGWYTGKNGSGTKFLYGDKVENNITLYAHYTEEKPVEPETDATITVSTVTGQVGNTIDVNVSIAGNPGIASMLLNLHYDSNYLKLVGVKDGGILGATVHSDDLTINPYILTWANDTASENTTANGVIVTLTFEVSEDTPTGHYPIMVSYDNDNYDIFDINLNTVEFVTVDGGISIIDHIIGDVNGDGSVNTLDRAVLSRYLSKWSGYDDINLKAADVNMDGRVNTLDRAILTRYLSKWSGYEVLPYVK